MAEQLLLDFEEWRKVTDFPIYEVSSLGRVRRAVDILIPNGLTGGMSFRYPKGHILKQARDKDGYLRVCLRKSGKNYHRRVNILVCQAFNGDRPDGCTDCAHCDGNRTNNTPRNLRWATSKENQEDRDRHGRTCRGSKSHLSKLNEAQVAEIAAIPHARGMAPRLAIKYGVSVYAIRAIWKGYSWRWLSTSH